MNAEQLDNELGPATQTFTLWALEALGFAVRSGDDGDFLLSIPEPHRDSFGGAEQLVCVFGKPTAQTTAELEYVTQPSRVFQWLLHYLAEAEHTLHAAPTQQPVSVHELSQRLFDTYTLDEGRVHLSGCTLDDRPLLRLTLSRDTRDATGRGDLYHVYTDTDGQALDESLVTGLELSDLNPLLCPPQRLPAEVRERWVTAGRRAGEAETASSADGNSPRLLAVTIIWCKFAAGKLAFVLGDAAAHVEFAGWARLFVDGGEKPPAFECPTTHLKSYHLTTTDDGRLTVAEAIGMCEETGVRVLACELETCEATGRRALPEQMWSCPVSRQRILRTAIATCALCRQEVSPKTIEDGTCAACRQIEPTSKDDPRVVRLVRQYPRLGAWGSWKLAETDTVYVIIASRRLRRSLLVVDKENLHVRRLAKSGLLARQWQDATDQEPLG